MDAVTILISGLGCTKGTMTGISTEATILMRMVYVVICAICPPSFRVTTAAAVAVGHMKHIMAPSSTTRKPLCGIAMSTRPIITNNADWSNSIQACHLQGLISCGLILQNVMNSIRKMRVG